MVLNHRYELRHAEQLRLKDHIGLIIQIEDTFPNMSAINAIYLAAIILHIPEHYANPFYMRPEAIVEQIKKWDIKDGNVMELIRTFKESQEHIAGYASLLEFLEWGEEES